MKVNINATVWVKLTKRGESIHAMRMDVLRLTFPQLKLPDVHPKNENGYRKFALWELVAHFGDCMALGTDVPFDEIYTTEPDGEET